MVRTVTGAIAGRISFGLSLLTNAERFSIVPSLHLVEEVSDDRQRPPINPPPGPLGVALVSVRRTCDGRSGRRVESSAAETMARGGVPAIAPRAISAGD